MVGGYEQYPLNRVIPGLAPPLSDPGFAVSPGQNRDPGFGVSQFQPVEKQKPYQDNPYLSWLGEQGSAEERDLIEIDKLRQQVSEPRERGILDYLYLILSGIAANRRGGDKQAMQRYGQTQQTLMNQRNAPLQRQYQGIMDRQKLRAGQGKRLKEMSDYEHTLTQRGREDQRFGFDKQRATRQQADWDYDNSPDMLAYKEELRQAKLRGEINDADAAKALENYRIAQMNKTMGLGGGGQPQQVGLGDMTIPQQLGVAKDTRKAKAQGFLGDIQGGLQSRFPERYESEQMFNVQEPQRLRELVESSGQFGQQGMPEYAPLVDSLQKYENMTNLDMLNQMLMQQVPPVLQGVVTAESWAKLSPQDQQELLMEYTALQKIQGPQGQPMSR